MAEKTCSWCGTTKDIGEFSRNPKMGDGHLNQCKECRKPVDSARGAAKRASAREVRRASGLGFQGGIDTAPARTGEEFRPIDNFPGYRVSNFGRVQSCFLFGSNRMTTEWRDLSPSVSPKGYHSVGLHRDGKSHRRFIQSLVLEAFVGPRPGPEYEACHFPDKNPANNHMDNLRWDTISANHMDKYVHGTMPIGSGHAGSKLDEPKVLEMRRLFADGRGPAELSRMFGVSDVQIYNVVNRKHWRHI